MLFTGEFEHAVDAKQRVAIPAEMRGALGESALFVVIGPNGALWLWPEKTFAEIASEIEPSLLPEEDILVFEELLYSQAARLELDSAGRVRIPERLLGVAEIDSSTVVLGMRDHIELRNPEKWAERKARVLMADQASIMMRARQARDARMRRGRD